ncbi:collagen alpha-1(III) chain-like [Xiphophorus hellerii]|uniref:collagen alpha-1(III) chain-like n=1 Tax=Xiphophorus hellerii TaxID=8084 RepID=UPI0013B39D1B|nr:collagen alpha-1(III) chain-like [Xiphophorus hellerii]
MVGPVCVQVVSGAAGPPASPQDEERPAQPGAVPLPALRGPAGPGGLTEPSESRDPSAAEPRGAERRPAAAVPAGRGDGERSSGRRGGAGGAAAAGGAAPGPNPLQNQGEEEPEQEPGLGPEGGVSGPGPPLTVQLLLGALMVAMVTCSGRQAEITHHSGGRR